MRHFRGTSCALAALISIVPGSHSLADTVYDNFGPGNTHKVMSGYSALGPGFPTQQMIAERFTPANSEKLTGITLSGELDNGSAIFTLSLAPDDGNQPGTMQTLGTITLPPRNSDTTTTVESMTPTGTFNLLAGMPEWIVLSATHSLQQGTWNFTTAIHSTDDYAANQGMGWINETSGGNPAFALRVIGTPLPEPGTAGCVLALTALAARRTKTRCIHR